MGKYAPLRSYLEEQGQDRVPLTFAEIERLLGFSLPASKKYPAWWSNNPSNNPMTHEWLAAGFETQQVDLAGEKLVFSRTAKETSMPGYGEASQAEYEGAGCIHPLYGRLKGVITLPDGVDLTEPAFPDWDGYLDQRYGPDLRKENG